jgi:hypothetical protein
MLRQRVGGEPERGDQRRSVGLVEAVGLSLSTEAAEGLALDLLALAQERREAREPED